MKRGVQQTGEEVLEKEEGVRAKEIRRKIGELEEKGKEQEKKDKDTEGELPWMRRTQGRERAP